MTEPKPLYRAIRILISDLICNSLQSPSIVRNYVLWMIEYKVEHYLYEHQRSEEMAAFEEIQAMQHDAFYL